MLLVQETNSALDFRSVSFPGKHLALVFQMESELFVDIDVITMKTVT